MAMDWGSVIGAGLQGVGSLYGAYNQKKMSDKLFKLQKLSYRDAIKERENARRFRARARIKYGYAIDGDSDIAKLPYQQ